MSRLRVLFITCLVVVGVAMGACAGDDKVRRQLLERTPVGTGIEQVLLYCKTNNLKCHHSDTAGYLNQDNGKVVGVRSVWAVLIESQSGPLKIASVAAYWGFDQKGKLIDIWVWKTTDAP